MTTIKAFINRHAVLCYFGLTFAISWGAVLIMIGLNGIPATQDQLNSQLPVAILAMLLGPSLSGLLLTGIVYGRSGFRDIRSRLLKWRVGAGWYAVAFLTGPLVLMAVLFGLSLTSPVYLPGLLATENKVPLLLSGIVGGVVTGICEELGWTGFAIPRLRLRYGILGTGLIMGVLWGAWHILSNDIWAIGVIAGSLPPFIVLTVSALSFLFGQLVPFRILMVWVYDRTGSLLVIMLMHACLTAATLILGPLAISGIPLIVYGLVTAVVMWIVAAVVAVRTGERFERRSG